MCQGIVCVFGYCHNTIVSTVSRIAHPGVDLPRVWPLPAAPQQPLSSASILPNHQTPVNLPMQVEERHQQLIIEMVSNPGNLQRVRAGAVSKGNLSAMSKHLPAAQTLLNRQGDFFTTMAMTMTRLGKAMDDIMKVIMLRRREGRWWSWEACQMRSQP